MKNIIYIELFYQFSTICIKNIETKFKYLSVFNLIYNFSIWWNEDGIVAIYKNEKLLELDLISAFEFLNSVHPCPKIKYHGDNLGKIGNA